jgi:hypothetical protein
MAVKGLKVNSLNMSDDVPGLVLLNTTSFSAVASHSLTADTFSSAYKNYRLVYQIATSTNTTLSYRFRTAGSDNSTSNYKYQNFTAIGGSVSASSDSNTSLVLAGTSGAASLFFSMDLFNPQLTEITLFQQNNILNSVSTTPNVRFYYGNFNATTVFDSASIITSSGTITGSVSVYGYTT